MRTRLIFSMTLAVLVLLASRPSPAATTLHDSLTSLAQDFTYTSAALFPMNATALGIAGHDGELEAPSEAYRAAYLARLQQWQQQLAALNAAMTADTTLADRDDARLLGAQLAAQLNALLVYQMDRKDYSAAARAVIGAVYTQFEHLPVLGQEGASAQDQARAWQDITSRLAKAPAYIDAAQRLVTMPCHLCGVIASKQLSSAPEFLNGALTETAGAQLGAKSRAYARFARARDAALAALAATKAYIDAHVASWPENYAMGRAAYDRMLREEQLLPYNADDIERMGRDELGHGWVEEGWLTALARHQGVSFGAQTGGGLAPGGAALIGYYQERIGELTQFMTDHGVVTVPAWLGSINVAPTPLFLQPIMPGANMNPPRPLSASPASHYYITPPKSLEEAAARLDMNQDFDRDRILSTAAHEVMPGHFMQLSIAKRHPNFIRRIQSCSAFAEGWAFYGEEMLVRLGLYGDHLDGRLFTARWERVRGARAIVDSKFASGEWSYEQAVDFYATQGGFTREAAAAAVADMVIGHGPGYYIAYTVGRAQIQALYADYALRMRERGSLHDFHDRLLSYGTTPFAVVGPELLADLDKPASAVRAAANY
jgi:uncharacterized protein (DUF885 family)